MKLLNIQQITGITGLSRTTIWRLERKGRFPERIKLGSRSSRWLESEVLEWIANRPRGMNSGGEQ